MFKAREGFIGSQFIEIIEWIDETENTIIHKFEDNDRQIKNGAQLIVRESQTAIFLNEGRVHQGQNGDVFLAGRHVLKTENLPILASLKGWKYGFESPFKADVYFINTKQFIGFLWGTTAPILMRDAELGAVRLRAHGNFSFKVADALKFFREVAGVGSIFTTDSVNAYLRGVCVSVFADAMASAQIPVMDLSTRYTELSRCTLANAQGRFEEIGLSLSGFTVEGITLPDEVERHIDKLGSMNVISDLDKYTKFQVAEAIPIAAATTGGIAGLGAQLAVGQQIAEKMTGASDVKKYCVKCGTALPADALFCMKCGEKQ
jgi:membrane protease subunit (stomatin/prohibitin family)